MSQPSQVRVRFAPSPTGYLHVGGARSALFNYFFAKQTQGKFILRVEDTDEVRSTSESLRMLIEDLEWLGLQWDEGPNPKDLSDVGSLGPYHQSQRLRIYQEHAEKLLKEGKAYYCFLSDEEIDRQRLEQEKSGKSAHVESPYADLVLSEALEKIKSGEKAVVRFKTKHLKKDYIFKDLVRGEVKFPSDMVGDFVLLRSGGMPVYNFCNVIDDHLMKISHVLRAEEHLPNTLRQLMLYEAFGWTTPEFAHMSLILDEDRKKLSKRKGATSVHEFKMEGYLPEALNNFLALLGWTHPDEKEIIPMSELIEKFDLQKLHSSGAVFDAVKLKWMNAQYLRAKPNQELAGLVSPFLKAANVDVSLVNMSQALDAFKPYMETLADSVELFRLLDDQAYHIFPEGEETLKWEASKNVIIAWCELLKKYESDVLSESEFLKLQDTVKEMTGAKGKNLFMPIRVAVIGKPQGTELKILAPLMKKTSLVARAEKCLAKMG